MKRILCVILTLCLLCAVPFTHAEVDYSSDYETALTLALNDLTNVRGLETAIDILQQLGGYQMARSYVQYFLALADIMSPANSFDMARKRIDTCARNTAFVEELAVRGFPACEEIGKYIDTRELEAAGNYGSAYEAYAAMNILDAPDRAIDTLLKIGEGTYYVTVIHRDETGASLDRETVSIPLGGAVTVRARDSFAGYALSQGSAAAVTVTADEMGRLSQREVVFTYRKLPDTVAVTVICRTDTGNELSRGTVDVECGGSLTVKAKAFDGYELTRGTPGQVKVFADSLGNLSQNEVVFTYKALPAYAEVTVVCQDENGTQLSVKTVQVNRGTSKTIQAESIDGYELTSESTIQVKVNSGGTADKTQVVFKYQRIKPKVSVGDHVTFGHYPQTAAGNDNTPIEWLVLDVQDGKVLLLSLYGLDSKPYNTEHTDVTWEKCTLREWLNNEFINIAFTTQEQAHILLTEVDNSKSQGSSRWNGDGGNNTQDKVFLLSYAEANRYCGVTVSGYMNTKASCAPTDYAKKRGAWRNIRFMTDNGLPAGRWWLRSPGDYQDSAAYVDVGSGLQRDLVNTLARCVRPALWVNLDADIF